MENYSIILHNLCKTRSNKKKVVLVNNGYNYIFRYLIPNDYSVEKGIINRYLTHKLEFHNSYIKVHSRVAEYSWGTGLVRSSRDCWNELLKVSISLHA